MSQKGSALVRFVPVLVVVLAHAGCGDHLPSDPGPESGPEPPATQPPARTLGLVEITLTGDGSPAVARDMDPVVDGERSGIQVEPLSTGSFTVGDRDGGQRYLSATFAVRNADGEGAAYASDLVNLTFVAVASGSTLEQTAVTSLRLFNGDPAPDALAPGLLPTGWVRQAYEGYEAIRPDVLQVLTEDEAAAIDVAEGVSAFPYGFVVRNVDGTRTLPALPEPGQFDGRVTFAFRLPLEADAAADPFEISVLMLATADTDTRVTQSREEQTPAAREAFDDYAAALGASSVTTLPGGASWSGIDPRRVCRVRTAGTSGAPTAHLVDVGEVTDLSPDPYVGNASAIAANSVLGATFPQPVMGAGPETFTVRGLQSGPAFHGQAYHGDGSTSVTTPNAAFFAGEEVEVVVSPALSCPSPRVARYRVEGAAGGDFSGQTLFEDGMDPRGMAVADFDADGNLDVVTGPGTSGGLVILLGTPDGTLQAPVSLGTVASLNYPLAVGDVNGDGALDLMTVLYNPLSGEGIVAVFLGHGDGSFEMGWTSPLSQSAEAIDAGDLNGDGALDFAFVAGGQAYVLLGHGDGTFELPSQWDVGIPSDLTLADLDGDGILDLVAGGTGAVVRRGIGDGTFEPAETFGDPASAVAIGDLNGDGVPDLALAHPSAHAVSVLLGDGAGDFTAQPAFDSGDGDSEGPELIAIGDYDGDDLLDLAVVNGGESTIGVLFGDGDGSFGAPTTYPMGDLPSAPPGIAAADMNRDGAVDLVVGDVGIRVLLNDTP